MQERIIDQVSSFCTLTRDQACNPGMCPDWESKLQPFGPRTTLQPMEPQWPGPHFIDSKIRTLEISPHVGYYKQCGYECLCTGVLLSTWRPSFVVAGIVGLCVCTSYSILLWTHIICGNLRVPLLLSTWKAH